jgi:hypothetical protein
MRTPTYDSVLAVADAERRDLRSGPAAAAKPTFALTHPSNLRETIKLTTIIIVQVTQSVSRVCSVWGDFTPPR